MGRAGDTATYRSARAAFTPQGYSTGQRVLLAVMVLTARPWGIGLARLPPHVAETAPAVAQTLHPGRRGRGEEDAVHGHCQLVAELRLGQPEDTLRKLPPCLPDLLRALAFLSTGSPTATLLQQ